MTTNVKSLGEGPAQHKLPPSSKHCNKSPSDQRCSQAWDGALPKLVGWVLPSGEKTTACIKWTRENKYSGSWKLTTDETNECTGFLDAKSKTNLACASKGLNKKIFPPVHVVFSEHTHFPWPSDMPQQADEFNSKVIPDYLRKFRGCKVRSASTENLSLSPNLFFRHITPLLDGQIQWLQFININNYSQEDFARETHKYSPEMIRKITGPTTQGATLHFPWDRATSNPRKVDVVTYKTPPLSKPCDYASYAFEGEIEGENLSRILEKIPGLKHISMHKMRYCSEDLIAQLARNPREIESLHFPSFIYDDYIATLAEHWPEPLLGQLKILNLSNTRISNKSLVHLLKFPNLKYLDLRSTSIKPEDIELLKKARPKLTVYSDYEKQIDVTPYFSGK